MRKIIFITLVVLIGFACDKKNNGECSPAACPAILSVPPPFYFNYIDSLLVRDQFWGTPRQYAFSDLKAFKLRGPGPLDTVFIPIQIDSASVPARFVIIPQQMKDTVFLRVQSQKVDTVHLETRGIINDCCLAGYIYSSIKLNGKSACAICAIPNIVEIRR